MLERLGGGYESRVHCRRHSDVFGYELYVWAAVAAAAAPRMRLSAEHPGIRDRDGTGRSKIKGVGILLHTGCRILDGAGAGLCDQFVPALRRERPPQIREFESFRSAVIMQRNPPSRYRAFLQ